MNCVASPVDGVLSGGKLNDGSEGFSVGRYGGAKEEEEEKRPTGTIGIGNVKLGWSSSSSSSRRMSRRA